MSEIIYLPGHKGFTISRNPACMTRCGFTAHILSDYHECGVLSLPRRGFCVTSNFDTVCFHAESVEDAAWWIAARVDRDGSRQIDLAAAILRQYHTGAVLLLSSSEEEHTNGYYF